MSDRRTINIEAEELDLTPTAGRSQVQSAQAPLRRELSGRLAGLSLKQQVIVLAFWPLLEQVLNFLVGFVDTTLAGHLSVSATKAIAVGAYVGWLIGLMQSAVGIGATAVIARAIGGRHLRLARAALGQAMLLGLAAGLFIGTVIWLLAPLIAWQMNLGEPSYSACITYLRILAGAAPWSAILFVGAASLRGAGDTRTPFFVLLGVNAINTVMSILFVWGPGAWGGYGVAGIAWGTFIGWAVGAVLILAVLLSGVGGLRLHLHRLRPNPAMALRIFRIGLPNLLESLFAMWIANYLVLTIVGCLPDDAAMAVHVVVVRVEALSYLPGFALGIAAATLAGQYLGLGDPQRARQAVAQCWRYGALIMFVMGACFVIEPRWLVRLVTDKPELLSGAPPLLRMVGFVQVFFATAIVLGSGMRGAGDTRATLLLTAVSTYYVRLPLAFVLGVMCGLGLWGVWLALCIELVFRAVIFTARFLHGGWLKARV